MVFLDLTEAFYRVVRALAVGGEFDDEHLAYIAHHLGYLSETLHEFAQQISEPSALAQAGAPSHVQWFMQALHTDTWFTIGDQTDIVRTEQGSRPGDSYADVVFGLLCAKLLRKFESKLIDAGVLTFVPHLEHPFLFGSTPEDATAIPFIGPTWMDDLSVCLCAQSNTALLAKIGMTFEYFDRSLPWNSHAAEPQERENRSHVVFPRIRIKRTQKAILLTK